MFVVVFKKKEDKPERPPRRRDSLRSTKHPNWTRQYRNVYNGISDVDSTSPQTTGTENNQKMRAAFGTSAAPTSGRPKQRKHKKSLKKVKRFLLFGDCTDPKYQEYYHTDPVQVPDGEHDDHPYIDDEQNTQPPENTATAKKTSTEYQTSTPMRQPRPIKQPQAKSIEIISNVKTSSPSSPSIAISVSNIRKPQGSSPIQYKQSVNAKSESNIRKPQSSSPTLETTFPYESPNNSKSTEFFQNPFKTEFGASGISGSDDGYHTTNISKHTSEAMFTETFRSEKVISRGPDSQEPTVMTAIEKFHSIKNRIHSPEMTSSEQRSSGQVFSSSMENFRQGKVGAGHRGGKAGVTKATEYLPKTSSQGRGGASPSRW